MFNTFFLKADILYTDLKDGFLWIFLNSDQVFNIQSVFDCKYSNKKKCLQKVKLLFSPWESLVGWNVGISFWWYDFISFYSNNGKKSFQTTTKVFYSLYFLHLSPNFTPTHAKDAYAIVCMPKAQMVIYTVCTRPIIVKTKNRERKDVYTTVLNLVSTRTWNVLKLINEAWIKLI